MNWYNKILFSAHNFRHNEDNGADIDYITNEVVNYVLLNKQNKEVLNSISLDNSYTGEKEIVNVIIAPIDPEEGGDPGVYNPQKRIISIYPYHIKTKSTDKQELFNIYKPFVSHEITHALDPSIKEGKWKRPDRLGVPKTLRFDEFNAYSKQIKDYLLDIITPKNDGKNEQQIEQIRKYIDSRILQIKEWMRLQDMNLIPKEILNYQGMLLKWQKEKPEYIRSFFDKLYNDLFGEIK